MKRAERRRHLRRMKAKAEKVFFWYGEENKNQARKNANHLACCSCWMCGNTRKWYGPTYQELKADLKWRDL